MSSNTSDLSTFKHDEKWKKFHKDNKANLNSNLSAHLMAVKTLKNFSKLFFEHYHIFKLFL